MSFIITLAVFVIAALLLVAYARKMQEGGFTTQELRLVRIRAVWVVVLIVVLAIVASSIVVVPVGSRLVVYNLMTKSFRSPLPFGYGFVLPVINERTMYDIRTQEYTMSAIVQEGQIARSDSIEVLSSDGLKIGLDITVLFHRDAFYNKSKY